MNLLDVNKSELNQISNEEFLVLFAEKFYSKDSFHTIYSAINKHIFNKFDKHLAEFTYEDYKKIQSEKNIPDTIKRICTTLFKYFYIMDIVELEDLPKKEIVRKHFESRAAKVDQIRVPLSKSKKDILNLEELLNIEQFYNKEVSEIDEQKMQFYWYLLSEYDFKNKAIGTLKSSNYKDGELAIGEEIIELNNRFIPLFEHLSKLKYDGFSTMHQLLKNLAQKTNVNVNLTPTIIRNTKELNTITCPNCQDSYSSDVYNWCAIQGKLVCVDCGNELKKIFEYQQLTNSPIETFDNKEFYQEINNRFETEKKHIIEKGVDFKSLHDIMMSIGKLGEDYVYNLEYAKLINTPYANKIDPSKATNPKNGYDILSYDRDGNELYIEVKATSSSDDEFYISEYELETAKRLIKEGKKYYVYFIKNILDEEPELTIINDLLDDKRFLKEGSNWKITIRS